MSRQDIQNYNYCNKALDFKKDLETRYLQLGEMLYKIKKDELYKSSWDSWVEYTWELRMPITKVNNLILIYSKLVVGFGLTFEQIAAGGGWSVIAEAISVMNTREEALHWIAEAANLKKEDLRKSVKEAKTGIIMSECKHKDTHLVEVCDHCGEHWAVLTKN